MNKATLLGLRTSIVATAAAAGLAIAAPASASITINSVQCSKGYSSLICDVDFTADPGPVTFKWETSQGITGPWTRRPGQESMTFNCTAGKWYSVRVTITQGSISNTGTAPSIRCDAIAP